MSGEAVRGTLYVVATPIGNLEDVTLRALRVLREASLVACEDTRVTRKLFARHGIATRLVSCHAHNEARRSEEIVARLRAGEDVALVSDAGTPGVSDPGERVIAAALAAGAPVVPVPGASAVLAALAASGLAAAPWSFLGFPPPKGEARAAFLRLAREAPGAVVLFEAPHRMARTLADLAASEPGREASLHREITKLHEEAIRGSLADLARAAADRPARGEYTLVLAARTPLPSGGSLERALAAARALTAGGTSARDAAALAAADEGVKRRALYRLLVRDGEEE